MILRWVVVTSALVLGLAVGPSTRSVCAQKLTEVRSAAQEFSSADTEGFRVVTTRDAREGRTSERSIIEGPSINGGSTVLSGFEDQERQIGVDTSRRTRRNSSPIRTAGRAWSPPSRNIERFGLTEVNGSFETSRSRTSTAGPGPRDANMKRRSPRVTVSL